MPKTVNELLQDASISHTINVQQFTASIVRRMIALLNRTDSDLVQLLREALQREPAATVFSVARLDALLSSLRATNKQVYDALGRELNSELRKLSDYELEYQQGLFTATLPTAVPFKVAAVIPEQVYAAALARPFQGRLLSEWVTSLEADRAVRLRDAVRIGFTENETLEQIIRRVRGTKANGFADGILQTDRRNAEAVVRTAVSHVANYARDEFIGANDDLVKAVVWHSTLDMKTSGPCQLRDGKRYTVTSHKPIGHSLAWGGGPGRLHWRCRSTSYPVVKSWQELGLDINELPASTRSSLDGQVPADTSYATWLSQQPAWRQDEVLGATRGALMRSGGLKLEQFYTNRGELLTLEQLRQREARAFTKAKL